MNYYVLYCQTLKCEGVCRRLNEKGKLQAFIPQMESYHRLSNQILLKTMFPGYVFITSRGPEALFFCLKKLPAMTKMMVDEEKFFLSLELQESAFLQRMTNKQHVIGLSYLETNGEGNILQVLGPLRSCVSEIVRLRFGKRYVIVRIKLLGKEKEILLGIMLKEDVGQEIKYGRVEAPMRFPESYGVD